MKTSPKNNKAIVWISTCFSICIIISSIVYTKPINNDIKNPLNVSLIIAAIILFGFIIYKLIVAKRKTNQLVKDVDDILQSRIELYTDVLEFYTVRKWGTALSIRVLASQKEHFNNREMRVFEQMKTLRKQASQVQNLPLTEQHIQLEKTHVPLLIHELQTIQEKLKNESKNKDHTFKIMQIINQQLNTSANTIDSTFKYLMDEELKRIIQSIANTEQVS